MSRTYETVLHLLDEAVKRLTPSRRTFAAEEALQEIWEMGQDFTPQEDPLSRFVLVREADGKHQRQWRLQTHTVANTRLLNALLAGTWDGLDIDAALARFDSEDHVHYVFCPYDLRFTEGPDGRLEPAAQESQIAISPDTQAALNTLGPTLLEQWHASGNNPFTVRQIIEQLEKLGWSANNTQASWLQVRAWLLHWSHVTRVGQDYWLPVISVPQEPTRTRLQVLPVTAIPPQDVPAEMTPVSNTALEVTLLPAPSLPQKTNDDIFFKGKPVLSQKARWSLPLRTVYILEGFLPVPARARSVYPTKGMGEGDKTVVRGLWFDSGDYLWLWLDRTHDRLYGPDLAQHLEWLEAGDILRIEWQEGLIVLRLTGHDDAVQSEEERLIDPQTLKALRGGPGESYRQSLQAVLSEQPEGLPFAEVVKVLCERQGHDVLRNTVRTLLSAGGFVRRNGRWFAASDAPLAARKLRTALVETLIPALNEQMQQPTAIERLWARTQAIRERLGEIVSVLQEGKMG